MDTSFLWFLFFALITAASLAGIIVSVKKLLDIKKGAPGSRAPWILLIILCGLYLLLLAAAIVFIFVLIASIAVNGM